MNTLFSLTDYTSVKEKPIIHDPYWDEVVLDCSGRVEGDGQATLFYDVSQEPPEPDDFQSIDDFESAWKDWAELHPDFQPDMTPMEDDDSSLPEQPNLDSRTVPNLQKQTLPEQPKQWIEEYYVTRSGTRHWYFRYCFYRRTIHHIHIPGGNIESAIAIQRKDMIQCAIAQRKSPQEIQNFIRGGFGADGFRLLG